MTPPPTTPALSGPQVDRAAGVLLATACGDALGAGYEFGPPVPAGTPILMNGGGAFGWEPGEWTDDTSMAMAIAEVAARGGDLRSADALDAIVARWVEWSRTARDVGIQTSAVLGAVRQDPSGEAATAAARALHKRHGRSGGNGSLMRTAPLALAYLDDRHALIKTARMVSALTHHDPEAGEACALWCLAIRHAVLYGSFDGLRLALADMPPKRAAVWSKRLDEAEANPPQHFTKNGWVVQALQGAWSAIQRTPIPADDPASGSFPAQHLQHALEAAVAGGRDTDTVAAIAGGLLGARWGASAVPGAWRRIVHGWPGYRARDLIQLALLTANQGLDDPHGWPTIPVLDYTDWGDTATLAIHPNDPGVWLGGVNAVRDLPDEVGAVISLCRLGSAEVPAPGVEPRDHVEVWITDQLDAEANANLDFVLHDTARTLASMRDEGHTVLVHCVQAISRTPTVAIAHAVWNLGIPLPQASADVANALQNAAPNAAFVAGLGRLAARH